ncbi:MAG: archaeoflavoprotein AfpA [Deltaproteobacteria bacterium]|nr:archaeoflavoprotein AfpA [Deltaproteobacteria bacterium]
MRIVWGITGAGDLLPEIVGVMQEVVERNNVVVTAVLSKPAVMVVKWYKLWHRLNDLTDDVLIEKDANTPFIVGPLQTGKYDRLLVAPATANSVAKIVTGIADTLITNAVSQTNKTRIPIYILPVDREMKTTTTVLPGGEKLALTMRLIDVENTSRLRKMKGITVLENQHEIKAVLMG